MTIQDVIKKRGIREVVHFTTHRGLLGILHSGFVKSRTRLPAEAQLEYIYTPNAIYRRENQRWLDYVNLSITRINHQFFTTSCRWHRAADLWWCILGFDSIILAHPGVYFATTNNIYTGVLRGNDALSLERLFAENVTRWSGNVQHRLPTCGDATPTCEQAEVLYPHQLSIDFLRRIYVERGDDQDEVYAQLGLVRRSNIEVIVEPNKFVNL
jgi:hypothetical protein